MATYKAVQSWVRLFALGALLALLWSMFGCGTNVIEPQWHCAPFPVTPVDTAAGPPPTVTVCTIVR